MIPEVDQILEEEIIGNRWKELEGGSQMSRLSWPTVASLVTEDDDSPARPPVTSSPPNEGPIHHWQASRRPVHHPS